MTVRGVLVLLVALGASPAVDAVPASIQNDEWGYRLNGNVLWRCANWPQSSEPLPIGIWAELGRFLAPVSTDLVSARAMIRDETWAPFVRGHMKSPEDVLQFIYADDPKDIFAFSELEPIPTKDQENWCRGLVDRWLIPLPEGFVQAGLGGGDIATWNRWAWGNSSTIRVTRRGVPKKGSGGPIERVYWFRAPMTRSHLKNSSARSSRSLTAGTRDS